MLMVALLYRVNGWFSSKITSRKIWWKNCSIFIQCRVVLWDRVNIFSSGFWYLCASAFRFKSRVGRGVSSATIVGPPFHKYTHSCSNCIHMKISWIVSHSIRPRDGLWQKHFYRSYDNSEIFSFKEFQFSCWLIVFQLYFFTIWIPLEVQKVCCVCVLLR